MKWKDACSLEEKLWQFSSVAQLCLTLCDPMDCSTQDSLSITNSQSLLKLISIKSMMPSTISSSVIPYSSCLQSFPESGSFVMSQLFTSGSQSIGASASASVLPTNIQDWFPLGFTCLISLRSKGLTRVFSNTTVQKHQVFLYSKCKSLDSLFGKQKAYTSIKKDYLEIFFHSHFISILIAS